MRVLWSCPPRLWISPARSSSDVIERSTDLVIGAGAEPVAQFPARSTEQRLVLLVRHLVDVAAQRRSAGPLEGGAQPLPVLRLDDVPTGFGEDPHQLVHLHLRDHAIEALPIHVDDPHHVAETLQRGIGDRLPDVALVELGVADERDNLAG